MSNHKEQEIKNLLERIEGVVENESIVKEVEGKEAVFIGDLHGDLQAFKKIQSYIRQNDQNFIFLGDYVDRGLHSVEILSSLFQMKLRSPEKILLLRGNHETPLANRRYGFKKDLKRKFGRNAEQVYQEFNKVFAKFPIVATLNSNRVIAMHGGIPKTAESLEDLKKIPKGILKASRNKSLLQVLWNDPNDQIKHFKSSMRGPGIYSFGEKAFKNFMSNSGSELLVRAHLAFPEGIRFFFNKQLVSIFSPLSYKRQEIQGKVFSYNSGETEVLNVTELSTIPKRS